MRIPVESLTETPRAFAFGGGDDWWRRLMPARGGLPGELPELLSFHLEAYRIGEDVYLEGSCEGDVVLECARCLARYRHRLREPFRLILEPAGERLPADPEGAQALERDGVCLGEELEAGWFRGSEIRLEAFFMELVALALPFKPLCRDDCAGLCPRCGADLSQGRCGCPEAKTNSPFAVLASLRDGPTGGES